MKKIKRLSDDSFFFENGNPKRTATVYVSDLDVLEQQRDELLTLLIAMYDDWKYIDYYADCVKEMIEKITGKTWEQIKGGKDEL